MERLRRLVRDLELEARGRGQKRDRDNQERRDSSVENRCGGGGGSNQSNSRPRRDFSHSQESCRRRNRSHFQELHQRRDCSRSREYADRGLDSLEKRQPYNAAMDAISRALRRAARSPFSDDIEWAPTSSKFTQLLFNFYNGKTDPLRCFPQASNLPR